ncbi:M48 family metalloprotease [Phenylobacterium sp. LjRoot219]|uniref:M48 family metalloprotease n=1 Tax=Phenylobacterium sp. LjRoot219 TaxID=3342283 RepID=UPI003ECE452B
MTRRPSRLLAAALAAVTLATAGGAAAQGKPDQGAAQRRAEILQAYGGRYDGPMAAYVSKVGERMAGAAGQGGRCTFSVIDTDVVNAFAAPPGCDIYITRGLLALIRSEGELAAVLGHEVGHVAANHAGRRQTRTAITGIGAAILGAVTGSGAIGQIANQVGQLTVLSYSRDQEYESDTLSAGYLASAGYSPYGLVDMLAALQASDQVEAQASNASAEATPVWSRTHPLTGDRIARALAAARRSGPPPALGAPDPYLAQVDGLIYGDDPAQGFVRGRKFLHPGLNIAFTAPEGFVLANSPSAVSIRGPNRLAAQFAGPVSDSADPTDEAYAVLRKVVGQAPAQAGQAQRTRINGIDAVLLPAQARSNSGHVDVGVAVFAVGRENFHFVTLAPAGQAPAFDPLIDSFRRLSAAERAEARPKRIRVVTVRPGDTQAALVARMAVEDHAAERFQAINGLQPGDPLRPGDKVKIVVAGS